MGTHWSDKRAAQAVLGNALREAGWRLYGWRADKSDAMTDYFDPERWEGVATKGAAVVVVGARDNSMSGELPDVTVQRNLGACARCSGTGAEPNGWTLDAARAEPRRWQLAKLLREHPGSVPVGEIGGAMGPAVRLPDGSTIRHMLGDVVSPIGFGGPGCTESCAECHGKGEIITHGREPGPEADRWPAYQPNPKGRNWHVEIGGRVVASGVGVLDLAREQYAREGRPKTAALVARIEAAAAGAAPRPLTFKEGIATTPTAPEGVTIREGQRPGYVDVVFPAKPAREVIAALKGAGFRWAPSFGCWYGKAAALPEAVRP